VGEPHERHDRHCSAHAELRRDRGQPREPNLAIRGIGTEGINSNAGGDASVVMFVDGVYIGRGGAAPLDLYDLERVEVLRGPQGTLFGKNVVGGAVSLTSRKPSLR
jgi:iron complex outermembrane recepter protein